MDNNKIGNEFEPIDDREIFRGVVTSMIKSRHEVFDGKLVESGDFLVDEKLVDATLLFSLVTMCASVLLEIFVIPPAGTFLSSVWNFVFFLTFVSSLGGWFLVGMPTFQKWFCKMFNAHQKRLIEKQRKRDTVLQALFEIEVDLMQSKRPELVMCNPRLKKIMHDFEKQQERIHGQHAKAPSSGDPLAVSACLMETEVEEDRMVFNWSDVQINK